MYTTRPCKTLPILGCILLTPLYAAAEESGYPAPPGIYGQSDQLSTTVKPQETTAPASQGDFNSAYIFIEPNQAAGNTQADAEQNHQTSPTTEAFGSMSRDSTINLSQPQPAAQPAFRPAAPADHQYSVPDYQADFPISDSTYNRPPAPTSPPTARMQDFTPAPQQNWYGQGASNNRYQQQPYAAGYGDTYTGSQPQPPRQSGLPYPNMDYGYQPGPTYRYGDNSSNRYFNFQPSGWDRPNNSWGFFDFNPGNMMTPFSNGYFADDWLPPANHHLQALDHYPVPQDIYGRGSQSAIMPAPAPTAQYRRRIPAEEIIYPPNYPRD